MKTITQTAAFALLLAISAAAMAQERNAYRHVDAAGNITYSQTPPVDGKDAKKVDITPAQRGRGGYSGSYSPYDNPRHYAGASTSGYERYPSSAQSYQAARDQRLASVKAECERQRGVDCNNPAAIQYLDSTSIPRRGRY